jgi:sulfite oxidase
MPSVMCRPLSASTSPSSNTTTNNSNKSDSNGDRNRNNDGTRRGNRITAVVIAIGSALGVAVTASWYSAPVKAAAPVKDDTGAYKEGLPTYTVAEVAKHKTPDTGIWVTYKSGVYDITNFVSQHPGGSKRIMLAAGAAIDPFWGMYQQHQKGEVRAILEPMRIGNLEGGAKKAPVGDPYANEPTRNPAYIIQTAKPFNAEPPTEALIPYITPNEFFFKRNHLPVPLVDPVKYRLEIDGEGVRRVVLSLDDLRTRFPRYNVTATIQCAGNRRAELQTIRPIKGLEWKSGAISTAVWGGVRLRDVLHYCGLNEDDMKTKNIKHIQFDGLDNDGAGTNYGSSIHIGNISSVHLIHWTLIFE